MSGPQLPFVRQEHFPARLKLFAFDFLLFTSDFFMGWKTPAKHGPALRCSPAFVQQCLFPLC
jgi:hypothetical protein